MNSTNNMLYSEVIGCENNISNKNNELRSKKRKSLIDSLVILYFNNPPNASVAFCVRDESDEVELFVVDAELLSVL